MSHTYPVADMLTRIRNALQARLDIIEVPHSKLKESILEVMTHEGYINGFRVVKRGAKKYVYISLKYYNNEPVITEIKCYSTPGRRMYIGYDKIKRYTPGYGIVILSTSRGIMSGGRALREKIGGELICSVY
ncbi:MAG: 30S ribosomal protein S8 [Deltaproteobacteria bacterium]|nr:30S ribosomal protein S8 [Deltaproteobacteria bacterium]